MGVPSIGPSIDGSGVPPVKELLVESLPSEVKLLLFESLPPEPQALTSKPAPITINNQRVEVKRVAVSFTLGTDLILVIYNSLWTRSESSCCLFWATVCDE